MSGRPTGPVLLLGTVVAVVVGTVLTAVLVMDSPGEERAQRLDRQRVEDLEILIEGIEAYWRKEDSLPADLQALKDWRPAGALPTDPESDQPYGYRPLGPRTYELCATFARANPPPGEARIRFTSNKFSLHPAGEDCRELEVSGKDDATHR